MDAEEENSTKTTCSQGFGFVKDLFIETFGKSGAYRKEIEELKPSLLYTRAWFFHMILMFTRITYPFLGIAYY